MLNDFSVKDVKEFLIKNGFDWTGFVCVGGENVKATTKHLTDCYLKPSLVFKNKDCNDSFNLELFINKFDFELSTPFSFNDKTETHDLSFAWQDFLLEKYPDFAQELKEHCERKLQSIFYAFDVSATISKQIYLTECAKYEARLSKLESGKSL